MPTITGMSSFEKPSNPEPARELEMEAGERGAEMEKRKTKRTRRMEVDVSTLLLDTT